MKETITAETRKAIIAEVARLDLIFFNSNDPKESKDAIATANVLAKFIKNAEVES